jgi:hypothetical protein
VLKERNKTPTHSVSPDLFRGSSRSTRNNKGKTRMREKGKKGSKPLRRREADSYFKAVRRAREGVPQVQ